MEVASLGVPFWFGAIHTVCVWLSLSLGDGQMVRAISVTRGGVFLCRKQRKSREGVKEMDRMEVRSTTFHVKN